MKIIRYRLLKVRVLPHQQIESFPEQWHEIEPRPTAKHFADRHRIWKVRGIWMVRAVHGANWI